MLTTLLTKAVVSVAGALGVNLDPHNKGLIAAVWLAAMLFGEYLTAKFHIEER